MASGDGTGQDCEDDVGFITTSGVDMGRARVIDIAAPPADVEMGHVCGDDITALIAGVGGGRKHGVNSVPTAIGIYDTSTIADADDAIVIVGFKCV